jgi:hypothetical protein
MGFQKTVNSQPAPAVAGDFASMNPWASVDAGPGALVAGDDVFVGRFAWMDSVQRIVNCHGVGLPTGFVHREQIGLLTQYLQQASMQLPEGFQMTLLNWADVWVMNDGSNFVTVGQKAYANFADGKVRFGATGMPATGGSATGSIAASTGSFTGTISDNIMTVTAVLSGTAVPGGTLSGTSVVSGTMITEQLLPLISGEALGGIGRYYVSIGGQTVASTTISETYGTFTAASVLVGNFEVGDVLSGSGVTSGTYITALDTGTGGLGTYIVSPTQTAGSTTISATGDVETKWYASSTGAPGELVKMTSIPPG